MRERAAPKTQPVERALAGAARRAARPLLAVAAAGSLVAGALALGPAPVRPAEAGDGERPNVIVVMTDDQTEESMRFMRRTRKLIAGNGVSFANAFATFPLCCPSRASFLTGQYAHNHGVMNNTPPEGGFEALDSSETLPVWLRRAGYYTALVGKYLNGYERTDVGVPPGWSEWHGTKRTNWYYGMGIFERGRENTYGSRTENPDNPARPKTYSTDVLTRKAVDLVHERAPDSRPFFLWLAYQAPHEGDPDPEESRCRRSAKPAARHIGDLDTEPVRGGPSFNERDVSDKPLSIRALPELSDEDALDIVRDYRCRAESLLAVDDGVAALVDALRSEGELDDTLLVFLSDNGFFHGEHRIKQGKDRLYEEAIDIPLLMRGPGVPRDRRSQELVTVHDLTATILEVAEAKARLPQDGISLMPVVRDRRRELGRELVIEGLRYSAVRTHRYLFARYHRGLDRGTTEMYDLYRDPRQLNSVHADPGYAKARTALARRLKRLDDCRRKHCRTRPAVRLKVRAGAECAGAKAVLTGPATRGVRTVEFVIDGRRRGDRAAPFKRPIPSSAREPRTRLAATALLLDGRRVTLHRRLGPC